MELKDLGEYVSSLDYLTSCTPTIVVVDEEGVSELAYYVTHTEEVYDFPSNVERKKYIDQITCMPTFVSLKKKDIEEKVDNKTGEVKVPESYRLLVHFNQN